MPWKNVSKGGFKTQKHKITKAQNKIPEPKWRDLSCLHYWL